MSDFDKFFAERLNEEAEFPRREKNWKALSKRLHLYYAAAGTTAVVSHLVYWKAAAATFVLVSGLLMWKLRSVQQDNAALRKAVAEWQEKSTAHNPVASTAPSGLPATPGSGPASAATPGVPSAAGSISEAPYRHSDTPVTTTTSSSFSAAASAAAHRSKFNAYRKHLTPATAPETETANASTVLTPEQPASTAAPDSLQSKVIEQTGLAGLDLLPGTAGQVTGPMQKRQMTMPSVAPPPPVPPLIRPYREDKSRFRAGAQLVVSAPLTKDAGITLPRGAGVNAEFSPLRNLWLTASADWMSFDVHVVDSVPRHYLPHDTPKPPKPDHELVNVEGNPRYQQYALGLRYRLPLRFWVQPTVRVAHSWVHETPSIFSFEFEEDDPGGPGPKPPKSEFIAVRTSSAWLNSLWRFGVGLEHNTPHWAFQIGLDYVPNQATSKPFADALLVQTGVQYKF